MNIKELLLLTALGKSDQEIIQLSKIKEYILKAYKLTRNITNEELNINEGLQENPYYKAGNVIIWNEWIQRWGKRNDTYLYRMITKEFIDSHKEYFEEIRD